MKIFLNFFHFSRIKSNFVAMKDKKLLAEATEVLERYLSEHHKRRTPERFALLEEVFSTAEHFYVDVLCESMEIKGYHVSRSTVYSNIQLFLDAGLVKRHQFGNQPAQYERFLPGVTRTHIHLVCSVCGRVREVRDPSLTSFITDRPYAGFRSASCAVYVYGTCSRCSRLKNQKTKSTNQ